MSAIFLSPQPRDNTEQPPVSHSSQLHQFKHQRVNWEPFTEQNLSSSPCLSPSTLRGSQQVHTEQNQTAPNPGVQALF